MIFGAVGALGPGIVAGAGSIATGFASSVSPAILLGPQLMVAVVAAAVAAGVDVVWLGTVAVLACAKEPR